MPATYDSIATTTLGSNTQGLIFNNIPQTYTDLVLVFKGGITQNYWGPAIQFNNNSGSYSSVSIFSDGSANAATSKSSPSYLTGGGAGFGFPSNNLDNMAITYIHNYTNTNMGKSVVQLTGTANAGIGYVIGTWNNTSAISSIYMYSTGSGNTPTYNLLSGTVISLYGITAA